MRYRFEIPGEPQGKARPRFDSRRRVTYTPQKTRDYEAFVRGNYYKQTGGNEPLSGAVTARITAYFAIPKSTTKRDRADMLAGVILPTKKPDLDNIAKAILDALNGLAYRDDACVTEVTARKFYSESPRVEVELTDEREETLCTTK